VPIEEYVDTAKDCGMQVIRIPMLEGGVPQENVDIVADQIDNIVELVRSGVNVLIRCKGGIGRASLVAACMLMRLEICPDPDFAVAYLRKVRSPHAVETIRQEDFIDLYYKYNQENRVSKVFFSRRRALNPIHTAVQEVLEGLKEIEDWAVDCLLHVLCYVQCNLD